MVCGSDQTYGVEEFERAFLFIKRAQEKNAAGLGGGAIGLCGLQKFRLEIWINHGGSFPGAPKRSGAGTA